MFSKQTCIYLIHSTQSVKKFGYLRKRRHNELLSPLFCPKVTKYVSPQLTQPLAVVYLAQWFPKCGSKPKQGWRMVKKRRAEAEPEEGLRAKRGPKSDWVPLLRHIEIPKMNSPRTDFTHFPFQYSHLSTVIRHRN